MTTPYHKALANLEKVESAMKISISHSPNKCIWFPVEEFIYVLYGGVTSRHVIDIRYYSDGRIVYFEKGGIRITTNIDDWYLKTMRRQMRACYPHPDSVPKPKINPPKPKINPPKPLEYIFKLQGWEAEYLPVRNLDLWMWTWTSPKGYTYTEDSEINSDLFKELNIPDLLKYIEVLLDLELVTGMQLLTGDLTQLTVSDMVKGLAVHLGWEATL